jgi:LuxR family transcriptional regulator, maltose regulon positive regulatory protein
MAPRSANRIVARERVVAQLLGARRKRCVVLQGPAGCGKTTTLVAWREALLPLGFDVAWLSLAAEDNDLPHFLDCLVMCFAQCAPAIAQEAALLGGRGADDEAVERTVISLVRGIAQHATDLVLVLDDLHALTNERGHAALQWLLDYAPPNLHVALVSRGSVPVSLGRLRDQGLVLELDMRDLRFTSAESEIFLRAHLGEISARDARQLHELTDGWAAGLQLFAMRLKRQRPGGADAGTDSPTQHLHDARAFTEYFEREVLSRLSATEVELLVRMAACTRLCAPLCVALVGEEQPAADVLALLARLESDNLFIAQVDRAGNETWYRLNPLFRETLLERFRSRSEGQQRSVHYAAWCWFRDHDQPDDAVRHALEAGEPAAAADLVLAVARDMQIRGDLRKLVGLMRLLPLAEIDARVGLRLWQVHLKLYAREFETCAADIARLEADIPDSDRVARYRLTLLRAALAAQRDDPDDALSILPRLLDAPDDPDGVSIGGRNNLLSWLYVRRGAYDDARRVQLEAQPLMAGAPLMGTSAGVLSGRCIVALGYALEGQIGQVERICRDVMVEADQRGAATAEAACFAAALLGEVQYELNQPEAARRLLEDRVDVLERVSIPDGVLRVLTVLSAAHWIEGHRLDAFAYLERLEEYAQKHGLSRLLARSLADQVQRNLQCGHFDNASANIARLDAVAARLRTTRPVTFPEVEALAARAQVHWAIANEDFEAAAAHLRPLIALCGEYGWRHQVAHFQMQSAIVDFRRGRQEAAFGSALAALRDGRRLGLVRSILDTEPDALDLATSAVQTLPSGDVLSFYVDRLRLAQQQLHAVTAASGEAAPSRPASQAGGAEVLSEREMRVLGLLAQALPNKKIARTLGISPDTVKWHLKNIYGKLGVSSRDEAVARMRDLELDGAPTQRPADDAV